MQQARLTCVTVNGLSVAVSIQSGVHHCYSGLLLENILKITIGINQNIIYIYIPLSHLTSKGTEGV